MRLVFSILASWLIVLASQSSALACACCDGGDLREIVGWSSSGRSAIVRFETVGCEQQVALEVWRVGRSDPAACFDLLSDDPDARIDCSAVEDGMHERTARSSRRVTSYPIAPVQLDPADVRARVWRVQRTEDERHSLAPVEVQVDIRAGGAWVVVWSARLYAGRPEQADVPLAFSYVEQPIEVSVWPSPTGEVALLAVSGHNDAPDMGHWPTSLQWIELPEAVATRRAPATSEPTLAVMEHRRGFLRRVRAARTIVEHAVRAERERDVSAAEHHYTTALYANPRQIDALVGLAAMHLKRRRGDGLVLLRRALQVDPEAVLRTEADPRFAMLRSVPAYWVLLDRAARAAVTAR